MNEVSVLFTKRNSNYEKLGLDCWSKERDATRFDQDNPVIAHPPCAQWGRMWYLANRDLRQKALAPWSVAIVRKNGGVLEHPYGSRLWKFMNLPDLGCSDKYGFTTVVDQVMFGHRARKRTLLYICGVDIDQVQIPLSFAKPTMPCDYMGTAERESTPLQFAQWLKGIAENAKGYKFSAPRADAWWM